jgi:hypothetical protein
MRTRRRVGPGKNNLLSGLHRAYGRGLSPGRVRHNRTPLRHEPNHAALRFIAQMIITDPYSKFKGEFKTTFKTLIIDHHLSSKGNHNAVAVERFNRFLNAGLRVFNNDRYSNRVFVEGSETLAYDWNSCPVLGTDLSRSLLVTGREFKFPIDFVSQQTVNFEASDNDKKSFASDLTTLLAKCRKIYTLLIGEHRAAHRECRNAQLINPKKFQLNAIVFTNVQVKSQKTRHTVNKLAYIRRGPYKIVRSYPNCNLCQMQTLQQLKNMGRICTSVRGN